MGAQIAIERLPHGVVVGDCKAQAGDGRARHQGREDQAREGEELDAAGAQLAEHVGVVAQLAGREDLDVHAALGLGQDGGGHFLGAHIHRVGHRQVVGVFVGELGLGLGEHAADRQGGDRGGCSAAQNGTTGQGHGGLLG